MTDEQMHADKGDDWKLAQAFADAGHSVVGADLIAERFREAMHDRDRFQAERDMWREEAERLQAIIADETWKALS